jgi:5,6,7,8-tetrahydromethanopterin hydro-lyase
VQPADILIGESAVGEGGDAAHINTVLGRRDGPVGSALVSALATPRAGHAGFLVVGKPGVIVQPTTLFVNKAAIAGDEHANLTWGPAQAGVARGVGLALTEGVIDPAEAAELALIAAVWVNPAAKHAAAVYENNSAATLQSLRNGKDGYPSVDDFLGVAASPFNAFFPPR